jgi:hypothetical protein
MKQQAERVVPDWREKGLASVWSFTIMELVVLDIKLRGNFKQENTPVLVLTVA